MRRQSQRRFEPELRERHGAFVAGSRSGDDRGTRGDSDEDRQSFSRQPFVFLTVVRDGQGIRRLVATPIAERKRTGDPGTEAELIDHPLIHLPEDRLGQPLGGVERHRAFRPPLVMLIDLSFEIGERDVPCGDAEPRARKLALRFVALPATGKVHIQPLAERRRLRRPPPVPFPKGRGSRERGEIRTNIGERLIRLLLFPERRHDAPGLAHGLSEGDPRQVPASQIGSEPAFSMLAVAIDAGREFCGASPNVTLESVGNRRCQGDGGRRHRLRVCRSGRGENMQQNDQRAVLGPHNGSFRGDVTDSHDPRAMQQPFRRTPRRCWTRPLEQKPAWRIKGDEGAGSGSRRLEDFAAGGLLFHVSLVPVSRPPGRAAPSSQVIV